MNTNDIFDTQGCLLLEEVYCPRRKSISWSRVSRATPGRSHRRAR